MMGATAGRTTLNGEGLQHEDGHSLVHASFFPSCRAYDPAFAYEVGGHRQVMGIERMYGEDPEDVFYYVTLYNENHVMPERPEGVTDEDIMQRHLPLRTRRQTWVPMGRRGPPSWPRA